VLESLTRNIISVHTCGYAYNNLNLNNVMVNMQQKTCVLLDFQWALRIGHTSNVVAE
jgi:hypothetical protein